MPFHTRFRVRVAIVTPAPAPDNFRVSLDMQEVIGDTEAEATAKAEAIAARIAGTNNKNAIALEVVPVAPSPRMQREAAKSPARSELARAVIRGRSSGRSLSFVARATNNTFTKVYAEARKLDLVRVR